MTCGVQLVAVAGACSGVVLIHSLRSRYSVELGPRKPRVLNVGVEVTALAISSETPPRLYAASRAGILQWELAFADTESLLVENDTPPPSLLVDSDSLAAVGGGADPAEPVGSARATMLSPLCCRDTCDALSVPFPHLNPEHSQVHLDVSGGGDRLLVSIGLRAVEINTLSGRIEAVLEGHAAPVTAAAFRPAAAGGGRPPSAVTVSEDRRFIVYDLVKPGILFQSPIVSSSPFIALAMQARPPPACPARWPPFDRRFWTVH